MSHRLWREPGQSQLLDSHPQGQEVGSGSITWTYLSPTLTSPSYKKAFPAAYFLICALAVQGKVWALVLCFLLPPQLTLSFLLHHETQRSTPSAQFCSVYFCPGHSTENSSWHFICLDMMHEACHSAFAHAVNPLRTIPLQVMASLSTEGPSVSVLNN